MGGKERKRGGVGGGGKEVAEGGLGGKGRGEGE